MSEISTLFSAICHFTQKVENWEKRFELRFNELIEEVKLQGALTRMALSVTEAALIKAFDDETNRIATALEELKKDDDPEFNAALQAQIDKLKGVGAGGTVPGGGV